HISHKVAGNLDGFVAGQNPIDETLGRADVRTVAVDGARPKDVQHALPVKPVHGAAPSVHQVLDHEAIGDSLGSVLGDGHVGSSAVSQVDFGGQLAHRGCFPLDQGAQVVGRATDRHDAEAVELVPYGLLRQHGVERGV